MITTEINRIINTGSNDIMSTIFNDLIKDHSGDKIRYETNWKEYDGDVKIKERTLKLGTPDYKANNKINNDFRSLIVEQGITYTFGKPITIYLKEGVNGEQVFNTLIQDFNTRNDADDLDLLTATYTAACGTSGRLLYIDLSGNERAMAIPPWEVIFIYNKSTGLLEYAMIYYKIDYLNIQTKQKKKLTRIEWYDSTKAYYFIESVTRQDYFIQDASEKLNPRVHGFEGVPVVEFLNNVSKKGDFDRTKEEIDAYDRLISDGQNELEDFRNAYMVFSGIRPDEESMEKAKLIGAIGSEDPEFDVKFLIKELSGIFHENHKKTLTENIFKFSHRIDFQNPNIATGVVSGIAMQRMLQALENDATMKERKFTKGLREQFRLLCSSWKRKNIVINYMDILFQFTRNLPVDLEYYGTVLANFFGRVPMKIIYSLLPFITDVQGAIDMMNEEREGMINLDTQSTNNSDNNQDDNQDAGSNQ